ncbi:AI-2E family transporter [Pararhodobacter zhoushanensis]|uniref:AI-2E family transporter n=1 Tax=Pararhodobacter zhoushanensis TaxID=2479545 RepID=A0ABT3H3H0_9RHOB|nr:AI-2E family transporter [Pararhodobacter zhoushanensis]MCW1934230.1 AI-2E family transporter [Pararhodobacter zhoushanensis]
MALPVRRQLQFWGVFAALLVLVLWFLGDVLLPFVLGMTLAYFLDPIADRLEKLGMGRTAATVTISLGATLIFVLGILLIVPTLAQQLQALFTSIPERTTQLTDLLTERFPSLMDENSTLRQSLASLAEAVQSRGGELAQAILGSAASVLNIVLLIVVVPVVAFYMLLDWDHMVARIDELLPRDHAPVIRRLASEIDRTVAAFVRGMGTVCLVMGVYYAVGLGLVGLQFGLVIGAITGLITFIPYVGALVGGTLALGLGLVQFWGDWVQVGLVAAVYIGGQAIEGNVLTPKLVGKSVGLHPVWLILALSVFGALFGFVGMLVAVPVAAAIGVMVRHATEVYQESSLYEGTESAARRSARASTPRVADQPDPRG